MNNPYENFRWLIEDIYNTLTFNLYHKDEVIATYEIYDIYEANMDKLKVEDANIDDITDLLTICIVRFVNMSDNTEIIDIPFRNLYKLYEKASKLGIDDGKVISLSELDAFAIIDGYVPKSEEFKIMSVVINNISDELKKMLDISKEFGNLGMQDSFMALCEVDTINVRRMKEEKNR